jgi:hypothetical protein
MDKYLSSLDLETLKLLYENETAQLRTALLNGALWEDVQAQRIKVTELAIALHQKRMASSNPAEISTRNEPNQS